MRFNRHASSCIALAAGLIATPAAAQTAPGTLEQQTPVQQTNPEGPIQSGQAGEAADIVVTGSFIRGTPEDAALPVDVISAEEIQRQGSPTLVELLKALPASTNVVGDSNQFGAGQTTGSGNVNLRGLGSVRTLVLLNGRRLTPSPGGTSVDTNLLPVTAVGRIEVLKDGAAALYGSDAIAGVVNFITRTDLQGFEANANYSFIDGSDGDWNAGLNFGMKLGDRGNLLLSANYRERSELSTRKRDFALRPYSVNPQGGWSSFNAVGTYAPITAAGTLAGSFVDPACDIISGPRVPGSTTCAFRYTEFDNLVEDERHFQLFGQVNYEFTDRLKLHVEGLYSGHNVPRENSSPSYSPVQYPTTAINGRPLAIPAFYIPASNPGLQALLNTYPASAFFNSGVNAATNVALARTQGVSTTLTFRPLSVGGNPLTGYQGKEDKREFHGARGSVGLTFDINDDLSLDGAVTYMENWSDVRTPDVVVSRLELALRGLGGFNCNVAANTPGTNGCLYFNPFSSGIARNATDGRANPNFVPGVANSTEVIDYIFDDYAYRIRTKLFVGDLVLSGKTGFELGGGSVGFAVGGQYRKNKTIRKVNDLLDVAQFPCVDSEFNGNRNCPVAPGTTTPARNGVFSFFGPLTNYNFNSDVGAAFLELQLPFTDKLNAQLAVRYENFGGEVGGTTNPKAALRWQVTDWLALRASASTTFRSPPQTQQINTATTTLSFVTAAGGYRAFDTFGNPNLQAETADTYNAGIIVQSGGFNATVDYYRFDFQGGIDNTPGSDSISVLFPGAPATGAALPAQAAADTARCAALASSNPAFYSRFTFNGGVCSRANLLRTRLDTVNGPDIRTSGIDFSVSLRDEALGGRLAVGVDGNYVIDYEADDFLVDGIVVSPGANYAGKLDYLGYGSIPDLKGQLYVQYDNGPHSLRYTVRHVGGMDDTRTTLVTAFNPGLGQRIKSNTTIDLNYTLDIERTGSTLTVGVQNLFDRDPSFARLDLNYDPFTGNPLGRVYKVGLRQRF